MGISDCLPQKTIIRNLQAAFNQLKQQNKPIPKNDSYYCDKSKEHTSEEFTAIIKNEMIFPIK